MRRRDELMNIVEELLQKRGTRYTVREAGLIEFGLDSDSSLGSFTVLVHCTDTGILARAVCPIAASPDKYDEIVEYLSNVNNEGKSIASCFEFNYRNGEIRTRQFQRCEKRDPSVTMIQTMLYDISKLLDTYWEGICKILKTEEPSVEQAKATVSDNERSSADADNVKLPAVISREELVKRTIDKAGSLLLNAKEGEISERDFYVEQMYSANDAVNGNIRECSNIASFLFLNEKLPQLHDPYLAYQWYMWGLALTDDENYEAFRGVPGGNYQGVVDMFQMDAAAAVLMFGSREQKSKSLSIIRNYVDKYWGATFLQVEYLIYALLGLPSFEASRELGYKLTDVQTDRNLAIAHGGLVI